MIALASGREWPVDWVESTVGEELQILNTLREPISRIERAIIPGPYPYYGPTGQVGSIDRFTFDGTFALIGEDGDHFLKYHDLDMTQLVSGRFNVNNHAHVIGDGSRCTAAWFHVFFRRRCLTPHLTRQGVGRYKLTKAALERLPILVPPPEEQAEIARVIGEWDAATSLCEKLLSARRVRRLGLMQQLLTGKQRFPGSGGTWQRVAIGDILSEVDRPVEMRDDVLYRLASVRRNWGGLFEREQLLGSNIKTKNLREIKTGDFLISHIQAAYGSLALVPRGFDGYKVSDLYTCLIPRDSAAFDIRFFGYLAQQARMTYLCRISSNGFFAERLRLNFMPEVFLQQVISIPPTIDEQHRIVGVLEAADHELALLEKLLAVYRKQKKGLMQQLLTGRRRLSLAALRRVAR